MPRHITALFILVITFRHILTKLLASLHEDSKRYLKTIKLPFNPISEKVYKTVCLHLYKYNRSRTKYGK